MAAAGDSAGLDPVPASRNPVPSKAEAILSMMTDLAPSGEVM